MDVSKWVSELWEKLECVSVFVPHSAIKGHVYITYSHICRSHFHERQQLLCGTNPIVFLERLAPKNLASYFFLGCVFHEGVRAIVEYVFNVAFFSSSRRRFFAFLGHGLEELVTLFLFFSLTEGQLNFISIPKNCRTTLRICDWRTLGHYDLTLQKFGTKSGELCYVIFGKSFISKTCLTYPIECTEENCLGEIYFEQNYWFVVLHSERFLDTVSDEFHIALLSKQWNERWSRECIIKKLSPTYSHFSWNKFKEQCNCIPDVHTST